MPGMKKRGSMLNSRDAAHILDCIPDDVIMLAREDAGESPLYNILPGLSERGLRRTSTGAV